MATCPAARRDVLTHTREPPEYPGWFRKGVAPSELVVKMALRRALPEFLLVGSETSAMAKLIVERQSPDAPDDWALAA